MLLINNTSMKTMGTKNNILIQKNGSKKYKYFFRTYDAFQQCCRRVYPCAVNNVLFVSYFSFEELKSLNIDEISYLV